MSSLNDPNLTANSVVVRPERVQATLRQVGTIPLPYRFIARMKYSEIVPLSTSGSSPACVVYAWRLNSVYDPNYTGTGSQPFQYDTLTTIYNNFLVTACDVSIRVRNSSEVADCWAGCQIVTDTDAGAGGNAAGKSVADARMIPNAYMRPLGHYDDRQSTLIYEAHINLPKQFGLTELEYKSNWESFGAVTSTNPLRAAYVQAILADPLSGSAKTVQVDVDLVFHTEFFGYKSVPPS